MSVIFCSWVSQYSAHLYWYWGNPNSSLGDDALDFLRFVVFNSFCFGIQHLYTIVQYIIFYFQQLPLVSIILWWPKFYYYLLMDPGGRSLSSILRDPRLQEEGVHRQQKPFQGNRKSRRLETSKRMRKIKRISELRYKSNRTKIITPAHSRFNSMTSYSTYGAYAHIGEIEQHSVDACDAINYASRPLYFDNPIGLRSIFNYFSDSIPEDLPNNSVTRFLMLAGISLSFLTVVSSRLCQYKWMKMMNEFNSEQESILEGSLYDESSTIGDESNSNGTSFGTALTSYYQRHFAERYTALMSQQDNRLQYSDFDTDGITWVIDNSATCIICNDRSQFIGHLREEAGGVETANGLSTTSWKGTIRITLTDDAGKSFTYHIPNAIYDKHSPYNIIGIPFLGSYFGKNDPIPSDDDDGTHIRSSANKSTFTWDHGRHERHFQHSAKRLPELTCEVGYGYFQAFATRIARGYDDTIHYAFSSAHTVSPEPSKQSPTPITPYTLGDEVIYHDGQGHSESCVYEGESVAGNHILRKEDGTKVITPASHIKTYGEPTLTNVPQTPLDYCKEIKDISAEDLKKIVYPRKLSPLQQEFLSWHNRLFHMPFYRMHKLVKYGILPKRFIKIFDKGHSNLVCVSCQFGKQHRKPWRTKGSPGGSIRKDTQTKPGDGTSVDQIVSAQPGLVPQMSGALTSDRIWGATIFVDHVTNYVYCHLMKALTLEETLLAKKAYEKLLSTMGHSVKHYRADNGRFHDQGFVKDVHDKDQTIDFCAVGHHGQNGIVENRNKEITNGARTLLLHGIRMWPQMIDSMFWPFALKAYTERLNCLQLDSFGQTPESRMAGVSLQKQYVRVSHYHTLFCPVYVLDSRLQTAGGAGPPKWQPRSRIGVYLGHSPFHSGSVALVWNPRTGRVSPQFHCVFDDDFTTVGYMERGEVPPNWEDLCRNSYESAEDVDFDKAVEYIQQTSGGSHRSFSESLSESRAQVPPSEPVTHMNDPFAIGSDQSNSNSSNTSTAVLAGRNATHQHSASEGEQSHSTNPHSSLESQDAAAISSDFKRQRMQPNEIRNIPTNLMTDFIAEDSDDDSSDGLKAPERVNLHDAGLRRSQRIQEKNDNKKSSAKIEKAHVTWSSNCARKVISLVALLTSTTDTMVPRHDLPENPTRWQRIVNNFEEINAHCDGTLNDFHHLALTTDTSNECYTYSQAMKQHDWPEFIKAMQKEVADHEERKHWKLVPTSTIPKGVKRIKAIWSFRRKRDPQGVLLKHKARLCCHGGMQVHGQNYWETYSPVVNALTVKLLLVIAKMHGLESQAIDFVLAFPQSDLEETIYMDLPIGFVPESGQRGDYALLLLRNLYGLKQASHNWFQMLKNGLIRRKFVPSKIDPCLYLKKNMMILTYVDDCIIVGKSKEEIKKFIHSMQNGPEKFILTDEGDIDKFLGVEIVDRGNGEFEMKQPHLANRIVTALGLKDNSFDCHVNGAKTPALTSLLNRDLDGKPRKKDWNYRQLVGMLGYLQQNTRPDIAMAVHQCARFCIDPKLSHEQAITRIGRYLRDTADRGIIYRPDKSKGLELFVDADFAGGWNKNDPRDVDTLYSRAGYVIKYAGCPIYWKSKLMNGELALSTAEAEFMALSLATREVLPLMTMMEEINDVVPLHIDKSNFHCKVWEDNQSCIAMTRRDHFTPRTKHIALKYFHFMSHVGKRLQINYVHTERQEADIFTKPVKDHLFPKLRYMLMGW